MIVNFSLDSAADDEVMIPADVGYQNDNVAGAFLFAIEKGGETGRTTGGFTGSEIEALLMIDKMQDVIDEIVKSSPGLTFAYLNLLEHRAKESEKPIDKCLKVQLDMNGIREQLKKDREEGSDAE